MCENKVYSILRHEASFKAGLKFCLFHELSFIEFSAKFGSNIDLMLELIAVKIKDLNSYFHFIFNIVGWLKQANLIIIRTKSFNSSLLNYLPNITKYSLKKNILFLQNCIL